jgi:UDP-glucose 4-epimerase
VTAPKQRVRRERALVTGASGGLGRIVCRRLHRQFDVVAVDKRPFPDRPKDVEHHELDLRRKSALLLLKKRRPDCIVHLGFQHDPRGGAGSFSFNVEGTAQLLRFAEQMRPRKFVFLSSAILYGPSATSSGFLTEESPLLAAGTMPSLSDLISLDMMVQSFFWKRPETETVILRPVHIVVRRR